MEFAQTGTVTATATGATASGVETAGKLTIGGNLNATAESSFAIFASGDISMTKGTVNATGNCTYSAGGICSNGAITISGGTLNVTSKSDGIIAKNDFWQKAGNVTVNADWNGIIVESTTNDARINEGTLTVTAVRNGIKARKFFMNGGHGYIKSTNTSSDSSYYAVKLAGNTSTYFYMQGNITSYGSTTTSSGALTKLVCADLPTYDYVYFYGYIAVNGVELRDGYYLYSGKTTTNTGKPSSGGYAYYSGNTLTLNNYEGSSTSASGIYSRDDLNIVLAQGSVNKLTTSTTNGTTYRGINVSGALKISGLGQLTISGGQYAIYSTGSMTLSSTQVLAIGGGIYSGSALNIKSASVGVYQLLSAASGTHAIQAAGDIDIDGAAGAVYINTPEKVNGNFVRGIVGKNITINSSVGITSSGVGIRGEGNVTIESGAVEVNAKLGAGIYAAGTMKITGGIVDVTAYNNGLSANKLVVTGGDITAISTYTGNDAANMAIEVADNTTTYFQIPSDYAFLASTGTTSSYYVGNVYDLETYDWVRIGDFVELHGVELRSGYYLASGNSANTPTLVKPSNGEYAYYADGVLTLCDYEYTGNAVAVRFYNDLTISMVGYSKVTDIIGMDGNLIFSGAGGLWVNQKMAPYAVNVSGDLTHKGGQITITADSQSGIYCNSFTLSGGQMWLTAKNDGITLKNGKLTVSSGAVTFTSTESGTSDSSYRAIRSEVSSPSINLNGLNHMVSTTSTPDHLSSTNYSKFDYDFVALGEFIMVRGIPIYKGYYINSGKSGYSVGAGSDGYAYVQNVNTLIMHNFSLSASTVGVASNVDLTIKLEGTNKLDVSSGSEVGINAMDNLVIAGNSSSTDSLTVKSGSGYGIYSYENMTLSGDAITASSKSNHSVYAKGNFTQTAGVVTITNEYTGTAYELAGLTTEGNLTVSGGTLKVTAPANKGNAIEVLNGNVSFNAGTITIDGKKGHGIKVDTGYLGIQGADVTATATLHAIYVVKGRFNMGSGFLEASSSTASGTNDGSGSALKLAGNTSDYYNVASSLAQACSDVNSKTDLDHLPSEMKSYGIATFDYVVIGDFVQVGGVILKSGNSINASGTIYSGNKGSGYAYYAGNTLTLNGYNFSSSANKYGIVAFKDLTISVTGNSSINTGNRHGIRAYANLTMSDGKQLTMTATTSYTIQVQGDLTLKGPSLVLSTQDAPCVHVVGNMSISNGGLNATSSNKTAVYVEKNLTVTGGEIYAQGGTNGIQVGGRLSMNDGYLQSASKNTSSDSSYVALKLAGTSSSYYNVADSLSQAASLSGTKTSLENLDNSSLSSYDYIQIGKYIEIAGKTVKSGYSIKNDGTIVSGNAGAGSAYYVSEYAGNTLTLNGFNCTTGSSVRGIEVFSDVTVKVTGNSTVTTAGYHGIFATGNVTFTGTKALTVSSGSYGLKAIGNVTVTGVALTLNSSAATALSTDGDVTVNSGFLKAFGYHNGIYADKVDVKGGNLIANSSFDGTDSNYYAVNSNSFTYASDLYVAGSASSGMTGMEIYDSAKQRDYDYIFVGDFVIIGGTFLPDGYFLSTGSTTPTTGASAYNYAYYSDGKLFLVNYTYSGTTGIKAPHDLELNMTGTNSYTATSSTALYVIGDLTVSGSGSLTVTGAYNGVIADTFILKGGQFTAISTNTASDSAYKALAVNSVNLVNIPSHVKLGNTDSTARGAVLYNDANRSSYDYVSFEHLVISIGGIEIGDGDYLLPGATKTTEVLPSGTTAYAQRVGNKLNLVNFTYTGTTASGIESNGSLNLVVVGTNKLTVGNNFGIDVALDLTISGAGKLTITGDDTCIYAGTGCTTGATTLKLTSNSRNGIQVLYGNFTMNDGDLDIYAKNDGINAEKVTINGGTALIKSNNMTSDSTYSSIWTGNFVVGSGLRVLGSTDPTGSVATDIDVSKLRTYDYIKVQAGTAPPVVSGVTVSGKVTSYITTGTVTIKLFKSGSSTAAYTTTVSAASGTATAFSLNNVAAGTYTMEVSKANHATRKYTITVGSSNVTQNATINPIGDVNLDGSVNAKDSQALLKHVRRVEILTDEYALACANVDGNTSVNAKDSQQLLQHIKRVKPLY